MAPLSPEQVRHIAKLARLELSEEEVLRFTTELGAILQYVHLLTEVDTTGVATTAQVTGQSKPLREDTIRTDVLATPDALLATSPLPIIEHQIETPSAHGSV